MPQEINSHEIIDAAENLTSSYFKKNIHFSKIIQLSEPDRRNVILRLIIDNPAIGMPQSIILKKTAIDTNIFDKQKSTETEKRKMRKSRIASCL